MILVYEYIPCGTLADYLYKLSGTSDDCSSSLTWNQRLNICIGSGRGIDYLHTGPSIIHRDVKSTNILLDGNFTAKVSDFGLAKHLSTINSNSHVSTVVKGSFGYLDPSYFTTGRLTKNSDTCAFGVALLEVLSGRPAVDPRLADQGGGGGGSYSGVLRKGVKGSHSWSQRVKVAVGAAKGLEYIHEKGHIHCNIKSSNVLLFDNGEVAKIADINLAYRRGQSSRSDVYCFGVVLLELLTGHELVDYPWLDMDLATWARPRLHKNKVKEIVDARLKGDYPQSAVATMAEVASRCVQYEPSSRPDMCNVVKDLQSLLNS
ncbi:hypothetical protein ACS0TY_029573 [Phlomoides rotata]